MARWPVKGPAVDDLDLNRAPVLEIGHPNRGAERQVRMGGGELALVEAAAACGAPAVQAGGVERGLAMLDVGAGLAPMRRGRGMSCQGNRQEAEQQG
jgi:hypothetical protein